MAQGQYDKFVCTPAIQQKLYNELRLKPVDPSEMVGYTDVRTELNQILTGPIQYPSEYSGLLGSGRGVFIFGPPGTGKTLVISTLVPQLEALGWRVLKVAADDIYVSAWSGEAEMRMQCIFETARNKGKVILLFDEGESLFGNRAEATAIQSSVISLAINELNANQDTDGSVLFRVVVLTNLPDSVDSAIRRRVGFNFCMRMPYADERKEMFCNNFVSDGWSVDSGFDFGVFNQTTGLFAGDDVRRLCSVMARDKIASLNMPFRQNASPFSTADYNSARKRVKSLTDEQMLKDIATFAAEHSNPCLTEYLDDQQLEQLKRTWTDPEESATSPLNFADNAMYRATRMGHVSYNAEEEFYQHVAGKRSREVRCSADLWRSDASAVSDSFLRWGLNYVLGNPA